MEMYGVIRHSAARQYKHRYIARIPLQGGLYRYFYDKAELDAYLAAKSKGKEPAPVAKPVKKTPTTPVPQAADAKKGKGSGGGGGGKGSGGGGKGKGSGRGRGKGSAEDDDNNKKSKKKATPKAVLKLKKSGKSIEEIAKILGISKKEAKKLLQKSKGAGASLKVKMVNVVRDADNTTQSSNPILYGVKRKSSGNSINTFQNNAAAKYARAILTRRKRNRSPHRAGNF